MAERELSAVGSDALLLFIMPVRAGCWRTLAVVELEAKMDVGANSEGV